MALDEPKDEDEVVQAKGFTLIVSKALATEQGGVTLDYLEGPFRKGFQIKGNKPAEGCASGCSC